MKDTQWKLKVKWEVAPDSSELYLRFFSDGSGVLEDADGLPVGPYYDWQQDADRVEWAYREEDTYFSGNISVDGSTMSGNCRIELLLSGDLKGKWKGYKR